MSPGPAESVPGPGVDCDECAMFLQ